MSKGRAAAVGAFVIKALSTRSLMTRIEQVVEDLRPFVDDPAYFGPDRGRRRKARYTGHGRRGEAPQPPPGGTGDQERADRIIAGQTIE